MHRLFFTLILLAHFSQVQAASLPAAGIATSHPLATQAGHEILAAGGNAFDAAVVVTAVLAVVEPYSSGMGGGGFWLLHRTGSQSDVMLDGREIAPGLAHRDLYLDADGKVRPGASIDGPLSAGIPGVPAALDVLASEYAQLPLAQLLAPAIRFAREGFAVDETYHRLATFRLKALRASPAAAAIFLHIGEVPQVGHILKQTDLANTLARFASQGSEVFYKGAFAQQLVTKVRDAGGIWRLEDLAKYKAVKRTPVTGSYKDLRIVSVAPPSSGGVAIMSILNQLSGFDMARVQGAARTHLIVEAMRRAYRDRAEFLGDADFVEVPVARLTSLEHAEILRAGIDPHNATASVDLSPLPTPGGAGSDTTHFSILDKQGNRVAATLSINYPFGSGFVVPGTGLLLNDEMDDFSAKPGVPNVYGLVGAAANAIEPYKRPLSSMSPTFIESERGVVILGTPGGSRIITMVLNGILEYAAGGNAKSIVSQRRFHHQYLPDQIQHERGAFTDDVATDLQVIGHVLSEKNDFGNMQVVIWERKTNRVEAASDPRGIGQATVK